MVIMVVTMERETTITKIRMSLLRGICFSGSYIDYWGKEDKKVKTLKKALVLVLACTLLFSTVAMAADSPTTGKKPVAHTKAVTADKAVNGVTPKVTTTKKGNATLTGTKKTTKKTVKVGSKVTVDGVKYTVKTIGKNAFKSCTKATAIELPSSVTKINGSAFNGCKNLKKITLNIKKASQITFAKNAFKGVSKKAVIYVKKGTTKAQLKKIKAAAKKAGFKGTVKVSK